MYIQARWRVVAAARQWSCTRGAASRVQRAWRRRQWALRARAARTQLMRAGGLLRGLAVRCAWRGWRARVRAQAGWWQEWQQAQEERRREEAEAAEQELVDYIVGDVWSRGVDMGCGTEAAASLVQLCSRGLARCSRWVAAAERDEQAARLRAETEGRRRAKELAAQQAAQARAQLAAKQDAAHATWVLREEALMERRQADVRKQAERRRQLALKDEERLAASVQAVRRAAARAAAARSCSWEMVWRQRW